MVLSPDSVTFHGATSTRSVRRSSLRDRGPDSLAVVLHEDAVDDVAPSRPEYGYLLEVKIVEEVLGVWSQWRAGVEPTSFEPLTL